MHARHARRSLALRAYLLVALGLAHVRAGSAQGRSPALASDGEPEWAAPPGCPSLAWVERRTGVLVAGSPRVDGRLPLAVRIDGSASRWHATVTRRGVSGSAATRELEGRSCRAVTDAAVALLAWAVREEREALARGDRAVGVAVASALPVREPAGPTTDAAPLGVVASPVARGPSGEGHGEDNNAAPTSVSRDGSSSNRAATPAVSALCAEPAAPSGVATPVATGAQPREAPAQDRAATPPDAPTSTDAASATAEPPGEDAPRRVRRRAVRTHGHVGLFAQAELNPLPSVALAIGGSVGFSRRSFRGEVSFIGRPGTQRPLQNVPGVGGEFRAYTGMLTACFERPVGPIELAACGAIEAGAVLARGYGVSVPEERVEPWVAVHAQGEARYAIGSHFALRAIVGAAVPFARPDFVLVGIGSVHQPSVLGARAALATEVRF